ncbi:flagellar adenylate kinase [Achlya hypogyna]|uniref:UMP-CMP kinase n=1 Tax=Achlya hypogyna TaxID=1202772 RepID=A0A1V9YWT9_ACHHY|nr:flagellar adenylate kinase [Achlya hypogyna]
MASSLRHKVLFVLGGPGAGKGTQCAKIVAQYGFVHLSAGDLLREERASGSANGDMIDRMIREGAIVPVKVTLDLIRKAMNASGRDLFLIDGFPRNFDNLEGWNAEMSDVDVAGVLFYDCPEDEMERRLLKRGETSGRTDDNAEAIRKRFKTYTESTMPIIDHFAAQNKVFHILATASPEAVFEETQKAIEPIVKAHLVATTQRLLDAVFSNDWVTYQALCDPGLMAIEPQSMGHVVEGMAFHEFYFKNAGRGGLGVSSICKANVVDPHVMLLGDTAVVAFANVIQSATDPSVVYMETRVWNRSSGTWKNVHFHRSAK